MFSGLWFFWTHYLTCVGQKPSVSFDLILDFFDFSHGDGWLMDFTCVLPNFYTLVEQEVMDGYNIFP